MKISEKKFPLRPEEISRINEKVSLTGFIDTHIHSSPDIKPRIINDLEAASQAKDEKMEAIILKSHVEPTSSRALVAENVTGIRVIGGICLNLSVGGFNSHAVEVTSKMGGKFVWLPTISWPEMRKNVISNESDFEDNFEDINSLFKSSFYNESMESLLNIIAEDDMVLATGHLNPAEIFQVLDWARSSGVKRIVINHPLTGVVGASIEEQKEMGKYAFLEHCFVACMPLHDQLRPEKIAEAIEYVGPKKCIMATDFGQIHNPEPVFGLKLFIESMLELGINYKHINTMCSTNPRNLIY